MTVSDYIFQQLHAHDVRHVFTLTGGGIMYLVDSLGRSGISYVCCHHEQAAAIAAQAYGMYRDELGVCLVTTGPGGTNALTGAAAAYVDSTPVLFLSGQVKRSDFASLRSVRQYGAQENDIISMAKPVCKYATLVTEPENIAWELEKCIYEATHGRKGPVWLDVPLDVQSAVVDETKLRHFEAPQEPTPSLAEATQTCAALLAKAKRPVILTGQGMVSARAQEQVRTLVERTGIPVLSTWRTLDFMGTEEDGFFGSPGLQAPRYSNLIIQHCDFLLVLGSRLDNMITAFNEERFAGQADKVVVDIDENEIKKLNMPRMTGVCADVKAFVTELLAELPELPPFDKWRARCAEIKNRYPLLSEKQDVEEGVDLYRVTDAISRQAKADDIVVISSTSRCNTAGHIAFSHRRGQKTISSMGMGSMGFALPSAVGAYFAGGRKRVLMIEGDGSFQLNLQELETIVSYRVDAKMFIFDNKGYAAIKTMQDRNFDGFYVGSNAESGVHMPDLEKIAFAYGLPYYKIETIDEADEIIGLAMRKSGPCLVDIVGALSFDEIPKCISSVDQTTGKRVSAALENPYPFLSESEMREIENLLLS